MPFGVRVLQEARQLTGFSMEGGVVVLAVDKDEARHNCDFYGTIIQPPQVLAGNEDKYDILIAANYTRFPEIKREALAIGVPEAKIQYINSLSE